MLTVCEMKYSSHPVGVKVIGDGKTIQPVLIVHPRATQAVHDQGYFYTIIEARQLIDVVTR